MLRSERIVKNAFAQQGNKKRSRNDSLSIGQTKTPSKGRHRPTFLIPDGESGVILNDRHLARILFPNLNVLFYSIHHDEDSSLTGKKTSRELAFRCSISESIRAHGHTDSLVEYTTTYLGNCSSTNLTTGDLSNLWVRICGSDEHKTSLTRADSA
jgi:hypothetical protein